MTNNIIEHKPILGYVEFTDLYGNKTHGYEVIYWENNIWKRYDSNRKYFTNGEQVVAWEYCNDCLWFDTKPVFYYSGGNITQDTNDIPLYTKKQYIKHIITTIDG